MTGNQQLGIRKNAEKSYGDFSAFLCGREEKVKLYLYPFSIRKEVGAGMTTSLLPKEALIKSLSDFTLGFLCIARNKPDANSKLFKEGYDEAMYKNSCRI